MAIGKTVAATSPYSAIPVWDVPLHAQDEKASTASPLVNRHPFCLHVRAYFDQETLSHHLNSLPHPALYWLDTASMAITLHIRLPSRL